MLELDNDMYYLCEATMVSEYNGWAKVTDSLECAGDMSSELIYLHGPPS